MQDLVYISLALLWIVTCLNLLLILAIIKKVNVLRGTAPTQFDMLMLGQNAPDFVVETANGNPINRSFLDGRESAIVFLSPTCSACRDAAIQLANLYPRIHNADVNLLTISLSSSNETAKFVHENGLSIPIFSAPPDTNSLIKDYKIHSFPCYYIINKDGGIIGAGEGLEGHFQDFFDAKIGALSA